MSFITVGYTDKINRRNPIKPPGGSGGGVSDLFNTYPDPAPVNGKTTNKIEEKTISTTEPTNEQNESQVCEKIENLSVEENCNEVKMSVKTSQISESVTTTKQTNINETSINGNAKEEINGGGSIETTSTTSSITVNKIINVDEKDCPTPRRNNRVPPGGFSSGLW